MPNAHAEAWTETQFRNYW